MGHDFIHLGKRFSFDMNKYDDNSMKSELVTDIINI